MMMMMMMIIIIIMLHFLSTLEIAKWFSIANFLILPNTISKQREFIRIFTHIHSSLLTLHCAKSVRIWSFSSAYFPAFVLNIERYRETPSISPYSVRMRENTDQTNFEYGHFSRSVSYLRLLLNYSISHRL